MEYENCNVLEKKRNELTKNQNADDADLYAFDVHHVHLPKDFPKIILFLLFIFCESRNIARIFKTGVIFIVKGLWNIVTFVFTEPQEFFDLCAFSVAGILLLCFFYPEIFYQYLIPLWSYICKSLPAIEWRAKFHETKDAVMTMEWKDKFSEAKDALLTMEWKAKFHEVIYTPMINKITNLKFSHDSYSKRDLSVSPRKNILMTNPTTPVDDHQTVNNQRLVNGQPTTNDQQLANYRKPSVDDQQSINDQLTTESKQNEA